jgi:hypothetical protein
MELKEPLKPGTKGIKIAFGDPENTWTYDLDESGAVINLLPTEGNEQAPNADMLGEAPIVEPEPEAEPEAPAAEGAEPAADAEPVAEPQ